MKVLEPMTFDDIFEFEIEEDGNAGVSI